MRGLLPGCCYRAKLRPLKGGGTWGGFYGYVLGPFTIARFPDFQNFKIFPGNFSRILRSLKTKVINSHRAYMYVLKSCKGVVNGMPTKTKQETSTLKYGYMWIEETTEDTMNGKKVKTVTKKIARDPSVGFFQRVLKI